MNECVMKPIISISVLSKISLNLEVYNFLLNIERISEVGVWGSRNPFIERIEKERV